MMSLTVVCLYIIIVLCFILFVNYKFLKIFIAKPQRKFSADANSNSTTIPNQNATITTATAATHHNGTTNSNYNSIKDTLANEFAAKLNTTKDVWSIPGPLRLPFFGTKWIYLWKYKMSKIHEVYRGLSGALFFSHVSLQF